jgi:hypothetical protein
MHEKLVVNSSYFCTTLQSILYFHKWHCEGHLTLERLLLCVKLLCLERVHRKQTLVELEYNTRIFFFSNKFIYRSLAIY